MPTFARRSLMLVLLLGTPAAVTAQTMRAAASPSAAVEEFMRAVADSNLTRMAELWGNAKGPAATTGQPKDYQKRMIIIQAMLRGVVAHAAGNIPDTHGMRSVTTELSHNGCKVTLEVKTAHTRQGWLVNNFDLVRASQVNQGCEAGKQPGNSGD